MKHKIALVGFGTVGQGLCEILDKKREYLLSRYSYDFDIVAVSDVRFGTSYHIEGLHIPTLLKDAHNGSFTQHLQTWDAEAMIREAEASVVCELAFTDLQTGQPAISHCIAAMETGKHVVTSNKGPAALAYAEMKALADKKNVQFLIEGTVMSGTPVLNLAQSTLAGATISAAKGILNGTTNYILSQMEEGMSYADALAMAQDLGYAEADPAGDVEGYDARAKVTILANVVMGMNLKLSDVKCKGITEITTKDIQEAKSSGARWKLIGTVKNENGHISAEVSPEMVPMTHPLAGIMGATNALTFSTDLMGDITIVGAGAGKIETGFSILTDLLTL
ncbi:homoserine dehydrogenase [bacterium]|nr:homoserine dehydrogenase [bacterium]